MGKKSKANRNKATASHVPPPPTATSTTPATATEAALADLSVTAELGEFPETSLSVKGKLLKKKGNYSKAKRILLQGLENGCVTCLNEYAQQIFSEGVSNENRILGKMWQGNMNLHVVLPLLLEGAIRGSQDAIVTVIGVYAEMRHEDKDLHRYGHSQPATLLCDYWNKHSANKFDNIFKELKEHHGTKCTVCEKQDSETVTLMKCDGCKFYYYCSKECQKKMWREGQHAGVCLHLGLLKKYHKPFAKKIWTDLVVRGIAPTNIPELVELRHRLGLSRPQADYQELLDGAQSRLDPTQLILPRKDGTVRIGSFPRPI